MTLCYTVRIECSLNLSVQKKILNKKVKKKVLVKLFLVCQS